MNKNWIVDIEKLIVSLFKCSKFSYTNNHANLLSEQNTLIINNNDQQIDLSWLNLNNYDLNKQIWTKLFPIINDNHCIEINDNSNNYLISYDVNNETKSINFRIKHTKTTNLSVYLKISNIPNENIEKIKDGLLINYNWEYFLDTDDGQLLNSKFLTNNYIFCNGIKINSPLTNQPWGFSYNLYLQNKYLDDQTIINQITKIIMNINDHNKIEVYSQILEHPDCYEWQISTIKIYIVNLFSKSYLNQYLIYDENNYSQFAYDLAIKENKHVIKCNTFEFQELKAKNAPSIESYILIYCFENYQDNVKITELDSFEKQEYAFVQSLLSELNNLNIQFQIKIKIINNIPVNCLFIKQYQTLLINHCLLKNHNSLLSEIFNQLFNTYDSEYSLLQFSNYWFTAMNNHNVCKLECNGKTKTNITNPIVDPLPTTNFINFKDKANEEHIICFADNPHSWNVEHTKPVKFFIDEQSYQISSWKEVLVDTCNFLYNLKHEEFINIVIKKYPKLFSTNKNSLLYPKQIANTNYFITTNFGSIAMIKQCTNLFNLFSFPINKIRIIVEQIAK